MNPDWMEEDALYTTTVMLAPLPAKAIYAQWADNEGS